MHVLQYGALLAPSPTRQGISLRLTTTAATTVRRTHLLLKDLATLLRITTTA